MHTNLLGGTIFGYVGPEFVTVYVGIDTASGSIALYRGGWGLSNLIGMVDNEDVKIRVMNRGWFKTKIFLEVENHAMLLETGNKFGDVLRGLLC